MQSLSPPSMCGGPADPEAPTDHFPARTFGACPNEIGVLGLQPGQPWQGLFQPADRVWRRRRPRELRWFLANAITELWNHHWPEGVAVMNTNAGKAHQNICRFDEAVLDCL